jgi:septum formation protein
MTGSSPIAPLWLASASPRRRELLTQLGLTFRVIPSGVVELARTVEESPIGYASRLAAEKAEDVALAAPAEAQGTVVLGADTIVVIDDEVLGKPRNPDHSVEMLLKLAGRVHVVVTGVALRQVGSDLALGTAVSTAVTFRAFDEAFAWRYVARGESSDKAGAYAIQGYGTGLVQSIDGSYTNVVGLPCVETLALLSQAGALGSWP